METLVQLPEGRGEEGLVNSAQDQRRLGSLLLEHGLVAPSVVGEALEISRGQVGKRLGEVLVDMGAIHERTLAMVLARKFRMPFVDLLEYRVGSEAVRLIPAHTARELRALPIQVNKHSVTVAVTDPLDLEGRATLRFLL